ncbi:MAG: WD40 repeat domain-containing protein [Gammaproteobacteria bacterium]|jgi:hypothetical protein|nr:WD40 repeat domain-containing protein [Gammaproteobacteria bacterium]
MRKLFFTLLPLAFITFSFPGIAQPGAFRPPLLDCGQQGDAQMICGTRAPEDFEVTPDGRFLIVAKYGQGDDSPLDLFDLATQEFTAISLSSEPLSGWGESACTESIGDQVSPHGLSLSQRSTGEWQFYVVNHNVRESMEMYELLPEGDSWKLVWHGCVMADVPYNDVAANPDGSFVATRPTAFLAEGDNVFSGEATGNVAQWNATDGESVLPGTEIGYPNGVLISSDGRYAYISGWTTSDYHKYDLTTQQEVKQVDLGFMPDNLTWTPNGKILAAGIKGIDGNCPQESDFPCLQGFEVVQLDPDTSAITRVFDSKGRALINGTSVAIEVGGNVYVGSFQGERLVKFSR